MRAAILAITALPLAGCTSFMYPRVEISEPTQAAPQPVVEAPVANGAIFQGGSYRPLFEDHRARLVGDTLVVQISEKVSASQKSTKKNAKK